MKKNDGLTYGQLEQLKELEQMSIATTSSQTIAKPNVSRPLPITDAETAFMQECCLYAHYYDGKLIAAKILTKDSEGPLLDADDSLRLSDVLYRYVKGNGG